MSTWLETARRTIRGNPFESLQGRILSPRITAILLLIPAVAAFGFLFIYPMVGVVRNSVTLPEAGLGNYQELFTDGYTVRILIRTLVVALVVAVIDVALAFPYAYMMTICGPRWNALLMTVVLIPFWSNTTAKNFGLMVLFQRDGLVHRFTSLFGIDHALIGTMPGVVLAMIQVMLPFAVLPMYARLSQIDRRLMNAAQGLGASRFDAFWRVYFPMSVPGVSAALTLVFLLSLGFYITPAMLGSPQETLIAQLIMARLQMIRDFGGAGAVGVFLLVATLTVLGLSQLAGSRLAKGRPIIESAANATTEGRNKS